MNWDVHRALHNVFLASKHHCKRGRGVNKKFLIGKKTVPIYYVQDCSIRYSLSKGNGKDVSLSMEQRDRREDLACHFHQNLIVR